jgi:hypothetical protein
MDPDLKIRQLRKEIIRLQKLLDVEIASAREHLGYIEGHIMYGDPEDPHLQYSKGYQNGKLDLARRIRKELGDE